MSFRLPQYAPVPLSKIVTGAGQEGLDSSVPVRMGPKQAANVHPSAADAILPGRAAVGITSITNTESSYRSPTKEAGAAKAHANARPPQPRRVQAQNGAHTPKKPLLDEGERQAEGTGQAAQGSTVHKDSKHSYLANQSRDYPIKLPYNNGYAFNHERAKPKQQLNPIEDHAARHQ